MTTRRSFLGAALGAGIVVAAPAIVRADSLMRVVLRDLVVEAPPTTGKAILALQDAGAREIGVLNALYAVRREKCLADLQSEYNEHCAQLQWRLKSRQVGGSPRSIEVWSEALAKAARLR